MNARRDFLRQVVPAGVLGAVGAEDRLAGAHRIGGRRGGGSARLPSVAADETYWREIQQAFTLDRTIINLNNGYTCPSPRVVHEALKRYLDISNQAPIHYMWNQLEPNVETGPAQARGGSRLRSRGARHHAQRQRRAADRAARHRSAAGR